VYTRLKAHKRRSSFLKRCQTVSFQMLSTYLRPPLLWQLHGLHGNGLGLTVGKMRGRGTGGAKTGWIILLMWLK